MNVNNVGGIVLGPLLFNIFINDILTFFIACNVRIYTDDNTPFVNESGFQQVPEVLKSQS